MKSLSLLIASLAIGAVQAAIPPPGPDGKYELKAPGIRAKFIPHGAAITNLWVMDRNGIERDIILGYDNASQYPADSGSHLGAIPGRYANRIGNAQFKIDGVTYNTEKNDGNNTLHSGTNGWGWRAFNVTGLTSNFISFEIYDPEGSSKGMPGDVIGTVTYILGIKSWNVKITAKSPLKKSPIMLTQHTYWNLDGFANPKTDLIWNHTYHTPYSRRLLEPDPNMVPTGKITNIPRNDINDFWSKPKQLGKSMNDPKWKGNCGTASGCEGYNNCWVVDNPMRDYRPAVTLKSDWSGIKFDIYTSEVGMQLYTCYWMGGTMPIKSTQGGPGAKTDGFVKSGGCVALEAQDWNDGINHPEWGRKQIYGPGETYSWSANYFFDTF